jgi:hypothetical protein
MLVSLFPTSLDKNYRLLKQPKMVDDLSYDGNRRRYVVGHVTYAPDATS